MERIKVEGIASSYGKKQVLKQVSFGAEAGTCTALVGVNGCGKSTLIKRILENNNDNICKTFSGTIYNKLQRLYSGDEHLFCGIYRRLQGSFAES